MKSMHRHTIPPIEDPLPAEMPNNGCHLTRSKSIIKIVNDRGSSNDDNDHIAYRRNFSCEHTGRYFRNSKRRLQWTFGFTTLSALREGQHAVRCPGAEHEVELVWSIKSGKRRVFWNGQDISNRIQYFCRPGFVEVAWECRSGETLKIIAHADDLGNGHQYNLTVDGVSFLDLPRISELDLEQTSELSVTVTTSQDCEGVEIQSQNFSDTDKMHLSMMDTMSDIELEIVSEDPSPEAQSFRLSMAGLNSGGYNSHDRDVRDELHSDLFSPWVESLRQQLMEVLPQTDEMVSRAIINAFFVDSDNDFTSQNILLDAMVGSDPFQVEAEVLRHAFDWMSMNFDYAPRRNTDELALSYMQQQIDSVFIRVRNGEISCDTGARILVGVAAILGLKFVNSVQMDTLIFIGLSTDTTENDLGQAMSRYGNVTAARVLQGHEFGFCRFQSVQATRRALAATEHQRLRIFKANPRVLAITENFAEEYKSDDLTKIVRDGRKISERVPSHRRCLSSRFRNTFEPEIFHTSPHVVTPGKSSPTTKRPPLDMDSTNSSSSIDSVSCRGVHRNPLSARSNSEFRTPSLYSELIR